MKNKLEDKYKQYAKAEMKAKLSGVDNIEQAVNGALRNVLKGHLKRNKNG